MKFLSQLTKITDAKYSIGYIHHMPFDEKHGLGKTKEELDEEGILVDVIPNPELMEGKQAIIYMNPATKEIYYEYVDVPKSEEQTQKEEMTTLKQQIEQQNKAIADLSMAMVMSQTPVL